MRREAVDRSEEQGVGSVDGDGFSGSRKKKLLLATSSGYLGTLVTNLISLVSVPISLGYFGVERYGVLALLMTVVNYFACAGLGVPAACLVHAARVTDRLLQMKTVIRGALVVSGSSFFLALVVLLFRKSDVWLPALGKIPDSIAAEVRQAALYAVMLYLVNLPLIAILTGFIAIQKAHLERLYTTIAMNSYVLALLATVYYHGTLADLALIRGGLTILVGMVGAGHFIYCCSGSLEVVRQMLRTLWRGPVEPELAVRPLLASGSLFLASMVAGLIIMQTDNLVISHFLGVSAVTPYQITFRLVTLCFILFTALTPSLLPLYGAAWSSEEHHWIEDTGNRTLRLSAFLGGLVWIGCLAFAGPVVAVWAGPSAYAGLLAVFALGGYGYSLALVGPQYPLLSSRNRIRNIPRIAWLEAVLNLLLSVVLIHYLGVGGVALGTFLASLSTALILLPREVRKQMESRISINYRPVVLHFCRVVLPALLGVLLVNSLVHATLFRMILNLVVIGIYLLASLGEVPAEARQLLKRREV